MRPTATAGRNSMPWPSAGWSPMPGGARCARSAKTKPSIYPDPDGKLHGVNVFGNLTFTLIQPLYTFGKIAYREEAAAKNIEVKKAGVDLKKGEVMLQVAQAYYGLILANQGKDAVADARTYLRDARERITRLLRVNSPNVKESDQYRLAMYEGGVEKFAAQAEEGAKVAYQALKALVGYGPSQDFQVPQELPDARGPAGGLDHYIRLALELRPEFTQLKSGLVARQLLVDAAKADRYPSFFFAVVGQVAGAPGREYNPDPYTNDFFNDIGAMPVVGAKWHFDFGILKAKIGQARAELDQLQNTEKTRPHGHPGGGGQGLRQGPGKLQGFPGHGEGLCQCPPLAGHLVQQLRHGAGENGRHLPGL